MFNGQVGGADGQLGAEKLNAAQGVGVVIIPVAINRKNHAARKYFSACIRASMSSPSHADLLSQKIKIFRTKSLMN